MKSMIKGVTPSVSFELNLPDPLRDARNDFLGEIMSLREQTIIRHGGVLNDDNEYEGPAVAAINDITGKFLYFLDGGEMGNPGYTVLPNRLITHGTSGLLPNIAGDLGATYDSLFEDIND